MTGRLLLPGCLLLGALVIAAARYPAAEVTGAAIDAIAPAPAKAAAPVADRRRREAGWAAQFRRRWPAVVAGGTAAAVGIGAATGVDPVSILR